MRGIASIAFLLVGVLLVVFGVGIFLKNNSDAMDQLVNTAPAKHEITQAQTDIINSTLAESKSPVIQNSQAQSGEPTILPYPKIRANNARYSYDSRKKGFAFEKYVVKKFAKEYFKIMEWTGDKFTDGIYAENTKQPDLVYAFTLGDSSQSFAVECKWRNKFYNNEVEIATAQQIKNYKAFEKKRGMPVFITLGIGGEPSSPKQLYIIPLDKIFSNKIDQSFLTEFEQVPSRDFYFDNKLKSLFAKPVQSLIEQV